MQQVCEHCGCEVNENEKFCGNCGNKINKELKINPIIEGNIQEGKLGKLAEQVKSDEKIFYAGVPDTLSQVVKCIIGNELLGFVLWFLPCRILIYPEIIEMEKSSTLFFLYFIWFAPLLYILYELVKKILAIRYSAYIITDKNIYTSYGTFSIHYIITPIEDIKSTSVVRKPIDYCFGVGDVEIRLNEYIKIGKRIKTTLNVKVTICSIYKYKDVYGIILYICNNNKKYMQKHKISARKII